MDKDQIEVIEDFLRRILLNVPDLPRPPYRWNYKFIFEGVKVELDSLIGSSPSLYLDGCFIDNRLLEHGLVRDLQYDIIKKYLDKRKKIKQEKERKEKEIVVNKLKDLVRKINV